MREHLFTRVPQQKVLHISDPLNWFYGHIENDVSSFFFTELWDYFTFTFTSDDQLCTKGFQDKLINPTADLMHSNDFLKQLISLFFLGRESKTN